MARTKVTMRKNAAKARQAPRKQLSARAPRKIPQVPQHHVFPDHAGRNYTVVSNQYFQPRSLSKLGIQLYTLGDPAPSPEALGHAFLSSDAIAGWGNARNYWPRVDVFTRFTSVEACVEHHRREKTHRRAAVEEFRRAAVVGLDGDAAREKLEDEVRGREPLPHIVPTWAPTERFWHEYSFGRRYRSWILVVPEDRHAWGDIVEKGLLLVSFDLDVTPAMMTISWDCDVEEDSALEGETYGWVDVEKSGYERCEPVETRLLCVRAEPNRGFGVKPDPTPEEIHEMFYGWQTPGNQGRLFSFWVEMTGVLWDCTYRRERCDDCDVGEDHEWCANELNEHYFDDDAQCIACRRKTEYRRRSKRIAARDRRV